MTQSLLGPKQIQRDMGFTHSNDSIADHICRRESVEVGDHDGPRNEAMRWCCGGEIRRRHTSIAAMDGGGSSLRFGCASGCFLCRHSVWLVCIWSRVDEESNEMLKVSFWSGCWVGMLGGLGESWVRGGARGLSASCINMPAVGL